MEIHSYGDMQALQAKNWWYTARRELIQSLISTSGSTFRQALDFGCGVGSNAQALVAEGRELIGLDAAKQALDRAQQLGLYTKLVHSGDETISLPDASLDLILAADVLEHIDDVKALKEMYRALRPQGTLLVTVPAHRWLWNWNDDYSHHLRRYEKSELIARLKEAGFVICKISSWNFSFVLPVLLISLTQRLQKRPKHLENNLNSLPRWINGLLLSLMHIENWLFQKTGLPVGVSLIAIAKKP